MLNYCGTLSHEDFAKEINNSEIKKLLMHIANSYIFWFGNFETGKSMPYFKEEETKDINDVRAAFTNVNKLVEEFLGRFPDYNVSVKGNISWLKKEIVETPLSLFTHVITHEFHHKGQVMSMGRQLGYPPPDADVIRL